MIIRSRDTGFLHPIASEITPRRAHMERRAWMQRLALGAGGAALGAWVARDALAQVAVAVAVARPGKLPSLPSLPSVRSGVAGAWVPDKVTDHRHATGYNNFYEFGTDKADPAAYVGSLKTRPGRCPSRG